MPMGEPGWPELAACTASMQRVRMVLMASVSMGAWALDTVRPVVTGMVVPPSRRGWMWGARPVGGPRRTLTCLYRRGGRRRTPVKTGGARQLQDAGRQKFSPEGAEQVSPGREPWEPGNNNEVAPEGRKSLSPLRG